MKEQRQTIGNMKEEERVHEYLRKKAQPKRIYVVAPTRSVFIQWCQERNIHWNNPNVTWINRHEVVLGRMFNPNDEIAYVCRPGFNQEELHRIEQEINMRSQKNEVN